MKWSMGNDGFETGVLAGGMFGVIAGLLIFGFVSHEQKEDIRKEFQKERVAYEEKLESKQIQIDTVIASYKECNKRYREPRPIICK